MASDSRFSELYAMDTTLALPPKPAAVLAFVPEQLRVQDTKVAAIQNLDRSATLPADKVFVAQVVTARLSGIAFPENPGEIAPPERTLRPYSVPMLPYDKEDTERAAQDVTPADTTQPDSAQPAEPIYA